MNEFFFTSIISGVWCSAQEEKRQEKEEMMRHCQKRSVVQLHPVAYNQKNQPKHYKRVINGEVKIQVYALSLQENNIKPLIWKEKKRFNNIYIVSLSLSHSHV
jgi:hypothetical protein